MLASVPIKTVKIYTTWWYMSVIEATETKRQENCEFEVSQHGLHRETDSKLNESIQARLLSPVYA